MKKRRFNSELIGLLYVIDTLKGEHDRGNIVGLNHHTGEPIDPQMEGIYDNYSVKRQIINSGYVGPLMPHILLHHLICGTF